MEGEFIDALDEQPVAFLDKDGYNHEQVLKWNFFNCFKYDTSDLEQIFHNVHPGNAAVTEEM